MIILTLSGYSDQDGHTNAIMGAFPDMDAAKAWITDQWGPPNRRNDYTLFEPGTPKEGTKIPGLKMTHQSEGCLDNGYGGRYFGIWQFDGGAKLLRKLEWSGTDPETKLGSVACCPLCKGHQTNGGHKADCDLARALKRAEVKPAYFSLDATAGSVAKFFAELPDDTPICSLSAEGGGEWELWQGFQATMRHDGSIFVGIVDDPELLIHIDETTPRRGK